MLASLEAGLPETLPKLSRPGTKIPRRKELGCSRNLDLDIYCYLSGRTGGVLAIETQVVVSLVELQQTQKKKGKGKKKKKKRKRKRRIPIAVLFRSPNA
jgi:hypothetical protein